MSDDSPFAAPEDSEFNRAEFEFGDREPVALDPITILQRAFDLVLEQPAPIILSLFIIIGASLVFSVPQEILNFIAENNDVSEGTIIALGLGSAGLGIMNYLVSVFFQLGSARLYADIASGNQATLGLLFSQAHRYLAGLAATFLLSVVVAVGLCLLIVPGIIAALGLQFAPYLIVHQGLGPIEALQKSWELTDGHKVTLFLVALIIGLLALVLACVTCGIGYLAALPVLSLTQAIMYHSLYCMKRDFEAL